jgi:Tol biopolymer transport system component
MLAPPLKLTNNPADDGFPAWSPDGRYIAFCRGLGERSEIWMIPALGGAERKLGEAAGDSGLSWSPDGKFLAVSDRSTPQAAEGVSLISPETGEKRTLTSPPNQYFGDFIPHFSPDGKKLAFVRGRSELTGGIYLLSIGGLGEPRGEPRRLTLDQQWIIGFDWASDGRSIVFSSGLPGSTNLWTIAASGGMAERLLGGENAGDISISRTGNKLVYARSLFDSNIWRISGPNSLDKRSAATRVIASTQPDLEPQFSPDGRKIVFSSLRSGTDAIWICDRDGLDPWS